MQENSRLCEYRIEYLRRGAVEHNYHYYMAYSPKQALDFQNEMIEHKGWSIDLLKIERKCPYSNKWIDESEVLQSHGC